jgi:hypothetical protein
MKKIKYYLTLTLFTCFLFACSVLLLSLEYLIDLVL